MDDETGAGDEQSEPQPATPPEEGAPSEPDAAAVAGEPAAGEASAAEEEQAVGGAQPADSQPTAAAEPTLRRHLNRASTADDEPAPKRRLSRGAVIGIVVAAVVVIAAVIVAIVLGTKSAQADAARKDAAASVSKYLTAVAHSDAKTALGQLASGTTLDRTLLTDAVLQASNKTAPLTGINVAVPTTDAGEADAMRVAATYSIGSTSVSTAFELGKSDSGAWLITDGTGRVSASIDGFTGMTLLVNGVKLAGSSELDAFPGTYTLTTSTSGFTIAGADEVTVKDAASSASLASAKPQLTDSGLQTYRFAIDKDVKGCISSKKLKTGCGLTLPAKLSDGTTLVDGTVARSLPSATKTKLAAVKPNEAASDGVKLATDGIGAVDVTVRCVKGGTKGTCQIANGTATYLRGPAVDMSHTPPAVSWSAK